MTAKPTIRVLSLGWGVQSFTIAAMVALGEIEPVDFAVHSDTGYETVDTYQFAERWTNWLEERGVKVVVVKPISNNIVENGDRVYIPVYTESESGRGMLRRQCTDEWKIRPVRRCLQTHRNGRRVELLQGISVDEAKRARDSNAKYITNNYPLLDIDMTRQDCIDWLDNQGIEIPNRSSCYMCPFHSKKDWLSLSETSDWENIIRVDNEIRYARPGTNGYRLYLHGSLLPIAEVVKNWKDLEKAQPKLF